MDGTQQSRSTPARPFILKLYRQHNTIEDMTVATVTRARIRFVTVDEAAEIIGVSSVRIRQFCQDGRLGEKLGNHWLITEDDARDFAEKERPQGRPKKSEK